MRRTPADWGPFEPNIAADEAKARLCVVRALARVLCGPRSVALRAKIIVAVADRTPETLAEAQAEFARMGTIDQRRILASYAAEVGP